MFSFPIEGFLSLGIELDDEVLLYRQVYVLTGGDSSHLCDHVGGIILKPLRGLTEGVGLHVGLYLSRLRLRSRRETTMPGFTWKLGMLTLRPFTVK